MEEEYFAGEDIQEKSLKDTLTRYLIHWKWFLASIILFLCLGYTYLRFHPPLYEVKATILIKDDKKGGSVSDELTAFEDLGIFKGKGNIDNEIEILKSRSLMTKVVEQLKLNVQYYSKGRPIEHERYFDTPILANYLTTDSTAIVEGNWILVPKSRQEFALKDENGKLIRNYRFGESISMRFGKIVFTATSFFKPHFINNNFRVIIEPVDEVVDSYVNLIKVEPVNKNSNAIIITLRDPLPEKAKAIINELIRQHSEDAIADKNEVSKNTADFINDRIKYITSELSQVEGEQESFKTEHKLVDVASESKIFLESGSASETSLLETNTQLSIANFMFNYIEAHESDIALLPVNLGLTDVTLSSQISEYNKSVLDRNRLLKNSSEQNPFIVSLDNQLKDLKKSIKESLNNYRTSLQITLNELNKQEGGINSKIAAVPKYEREYRIMQRQQQIKEALYLYLLQKREETNLTLAVTVANAKVIDSAYSDGKIVEPKKDLIYLLSLMLGFFLPIAGFYFRDLFDTKVHGKKDIELLQIPYLGEIPQSESKSKLVVTKNERSGIAEAFRLLRTNVEFLNSGKKEKNKTIFVTSTIGKEGKSFIALNLAATIALSDKRTLLVGTDLRAPKVMSYLGLADARGLTNFIMDPDLKLEDVIFQVPGLSNFDVLPSGTIPPNPSELLMNPRINEFFENIKSKYDYIIVDTAPVSLVTDTLLISKYADSTIFVTRANYLDKRMLHTAVSLYREKRLPNMAVLINGTDFRYHYGYGYGYGNAYGYGHDKPTPRWKKILTRNSA